MWDTRWNELLSCPEAETYVLPIYAAILSTILYFYLLENSQIASGMPASHVPAMFRNISFAIKIYNIASM
jgi:hypothetical protein